MSSPELAFQQPGGGRCCELRWSTALILRLALQEPRLENKSAAAATTKIGNNPIPTPDPCAAVTASAENTHHSTRTVTKGLSQILRL